MAVWPDDGGLLNGYSDQLSDEALCETVTQHAAKYRWITDGSTPGKFDPDDNPPLNAVADACSPGNPARRVILVKCNQSGGTVTAFNVVEYFMHQQPGNILWVVPRDKDVTKFMGRVDSFLNSSPLLRRLVIGSSIVDVAEAATKRKTNRIGQIAYRGGEIVIAASGVAETFQEKPYVLVILDDASRFEDNPEGDHLALAELRTNTYSRMGAKVFMVSTPATEPDNTWSALTQSSWNECYVPCPHCGAEQVLTMDNLRWTKGAPSTAHFVCIHCRKAIYEQSKAWMLARHEWRPKQPEYQGRAEGYHFPAFYARSISRSWSDIARSREDAVEAMRRTGKGNAMQVSKNLDEALLWTPPALVKLAGVGREVFKRREPEAVMIDDALARGLMSSAGTDRQHNRLESGVWRWGPGREGWSMDHMVHRGDTLQDDVWNRWFDWLVTTGATAACVDGADQTQETCNQITRFFDPENERNFDLAGIMVWVIKGADRAGPPWPKPIESGNIDPMTGMVRLVSNVKVDELTGQILDSLYTVQSSGPRYLHIPKTRDQGWVKQLLGRRERISTDPRSGGKYVPVKGRRREVLDYTKYALAALYGAAAIGDPAALAAVGVGTAQPPPPPPPLPKRPGRVATTRPRSRGRRPAKFQL
jgi:phage terminase large subunit GpA-like protein